MKAKSFASVALIILLALPSVALAQNPSGSSPDWSPVRSLTTGQKLSVRLKDGKKVEGNLVSVSDDGLTIERSGRSTNVDRPNVERVYRVLPKSVGKSIGKSTLIGAGVGFGAGAGVSLAAGSYEDFETGELIIALGGIGAAIGAGIGAVVGAIASTGKKKVLIYDAR